MRRTAFLVMVLLSGCKWGNDSALSTMPNAELRKQNYHCQMAGSLSAAEIQVCRNIRRECDDRASKGNYVC